VKPSLSSVDDALSDIKRLIEKHHSFVLLEHEKPDGDCVGSGLALVQALQNLGKQALLISQDPHPAVYDFLPGNEFHTRAQYIEPEDFHAEVAVFIDCTDPERAGKGLELAKNSVWVNIDHHVSNTGFGDVSLVCPSAAATGEIIYKLLLAMEVSITKEIATCLFVAIATDTGGFRYQNTTKETFEIAGALTGYGANPWEIAEQIFETRSVSSVLLLGKALNTLKVSRGGKLATLAVTRDMMAQAGASADETEGIIGFPRSISGVEVSLLFREMEDGSGFHVSFRSRSKVDVSKIAMRLGGGGHPRAAGALVGGTLEEAFRKVLAILDELDIWTDS
jgi:phosphoesterase RecJ-like protein